MSFPLTHFTREQALTFIMSHEKQAKRLFLIEVEKTFEKPLPPWVRAKFLGAGDQYGPMKLQQEWKWELEQEVWDGMMYAGLELCKNDFYKAPVL